MGESVAALLSRLPVVALPALAIAGAISAIAAPSGVEPPTSYAGASAAANAADLSAGLGLVLAGAVAWTQPRTRLLGLLATLAGLAWFGPDWDGWQDGPSLVRSLGALASPFFLPLIFHLALAFPGRRLPSRAAKLAVTAVYAIAAAVSIGGALFRDPFLDLYCWRNCLDNAFLVHADPGLASGLEDVWLRSAAVVGVVLAAIGARRLLMATGPARRILLPVLVPAMLAGVAVVAYALALVREPLEDPSRAGFATIFFARSLSAYALACGVAWSVLHTLRMRSSVSRLAAELAEAPPAGRLREGLANALRDSELEVLYWLPDSDRFVSGDGRVAAQPVPGDGRVVTSIARAGQPVALVAHHAALLDRHELEREIGSAARLAIENERLQAEVLAQLDELRSSRTRVVEAGDAERRRLERNLHDGAQQRLLAVSYDLRLAGAAASKDGDRELCRLLTQATKEVDVALGELRELAHGIYPGVLTEAGLGKALETLADTAPLPVELGDLTPARHASSVEATAYYAVEQSIQDASARGATFLAVAARRAGNRLVVEIEDDGADREAELSHVADRVGALGGSLETGPSSMRAELPCE
jgi:signal transduction histidine kinase